MGTIPLNTQLAFNHLNRERSFLEMLSNTDQWARCYFGQGRSDHSMKTNLSWCNIVDWSPMIILWVLLELLSMLMKSHLITFLIKKPARQSHRIGELRTDFFFLGSLNFYFLYRDLVELSIFHPLTQPSKTLKYSLYILPHSLFLIFIL